MMYLRLLESIEFYRYHRQARRRPAAAVQALRRNGPRSPCRGAAVPRGSRPRGAFACANEGVSVAARPTTPARSWGISGGVAPRSAAARSDGRDAAAEGAVSRITSCGPPVRMVNSISSRRIRTTRRRRSILTLSTSDTRRRVKRPVPCTACHNVATTLSSSMAAIRADARAGVEKRRAAEKIEQKPHALSSTSAPHSTEPGDEQQYSQRNRPQHGHLNRW